MTMITPAPDQTLEDLINKTLRYLEPSQIDLAAVLSVDYTAGNATMTVSGVANSAAAIALGATLAVDLEVFYVTGYDSGTGVVDVVPGYQGSIPADHTAGVLVWINPKFTAFDVATAINDDLADLSSPDNAVFQVGVSAFTYNPTYMGYDLGAPTMDPPFPDNFIDILVMRYRIPTPTHNFPLLANWALSRNVTDPIFPSGNGVILYESAYPGMPVYVTWFAPLGQFENLSDIVVTTTGLQPSAIDLPPLGAAIRLVEGREVKRNFIESQPDPRRAQDVPPGAVLNSTRGWIARRQSRIDAESDRIKRQFPQLRKY
jgi:hypothetical protein